MGSRRGGGPVVEDGLTLTLGKLMRDGSLIPDADVHGSLTWTNPITGERIASLGYHAELGHELGRLRLSYSRRGRPLDYGIDLATTPQPFGGRRWWFVCPLSGSRVAKLYLPPGRETFGSRTAHRLTYRCQRETRENRAINAAWKAKLALGGKIGTMLGCFIQKPKYRHERTFRRDLAALRAKEAVTNEHTEAFIGKIARRARIGLSRSAASNKRDRATALAVNAEAV